MWDETSQIKAYVGFLYTDMLQMYWKVCPSWQCQLDGGAPLQGLLEALSDTSTLAEVPAKRRRILGREGFREFSPPWTLPYL